MPPIHLSQLRKMLDSPKPFTIKVWTAKGEIETYENCVSLKYDFYRGTRRIKLMSSRQIRTVRDVCIFRFNDIEVYL